MMDSNDCNSRKRLKKKKEKKIQESKRKTERRKKQHTKPIEKKAPYTRIHCTKITLEKSIR